MLSRWPVQAARRCSSRAASSACSAAAALGASAAACTRRSISASVPLACTCVSVEIACAVCASASQISCWRVAVCAPACCHSWRSVAAMAPRDSVQAARRCSSRALSSVCSARAALGASAAACTSRSISAMVPLAWAWACAEMSLAVCASAAQISCWRVAACALACSHWPRSPVAMLPSASVQAARRCSSRALSSACMASAALGASAAACTSRSISAMVPLACACACAPISRAVCASVSLIACWRLAAWALAWSHCWRSASVMLPSVPAHAARRCSSCDARPDWRSACDWPTVRTSDAACCSNAAVAAASACWLSAASFSPMRACCDRASVHACAVLAEVDSRRAATCSTRPAERCSNVCAKPSSAPRSSPARASLLRCWLASASFQIPATPAVEVSKRAEMPSSCCCTDCVTASRMAAVSRARPAMVASTAGWIAVPAARALSATLSFSDCPTEAASCVYTASVLPWKAS
ncbi:hypothetical protein D9M72_307240 [compost metagenome]